MPVSALHGPSCNQKITTSNARPVSQASRLFEATLQYESNPLSDKELDVFHQQEVHAGATRRHLRQWKPPSPSTMDANASKQHRDRS
jgi:hypothetical protein